MLSYTTYVNNDEVRAVVDRLTARLSQLPGVDRVAITGSVPTFTFSHRGNLVIEGQPVDQGKEPLALAERVTPGYFQTLGIPLLAGRDFAGDDRAGSKQVAVINRALPQVLAEGRRHRPQDRRQRVADASMEGDRGDRERHPVSHDPGQLIYPVPGIPAVRPGPGALARVRPPQRGRPGSTCAGGAPRRGKGRSRPRRRRPGNRRLPNGRAQTNMAQNKHRFRIGMKLTAVLANFVDGKLMGFEWETIG